MRHKVADLVQILRNRWRTMNVWKKTLIIAILFSFISLLYQAVSFAGSNRYQIQTLGDVVDNGLTPPPELQLRIDYPYWVRFEEPGDFGHPISVWLVPKPATSVSSPVTYTVRFEPSDNGLLFTDEEGNSTSPQVEVVVRSNVEAPGLIYLHPAPLRDNMPSLVQLKVGIEGPPPSKVSLDEPLSLMVRVEKHWVAGLRRFLDLLLGPTAFLLAVAGGLISWGLQQQARERERIEQAELSIKIRAIQRLAEIGDQGEAIYQWWKYDRQAETNPDWQKPDLRAALEDVWQKISIDSWQLAVLRGAIKHLGSNERVVAREMAELIHNLDSDGRPPAALAAKLLIAHLDKSQEAVDSTLKVGSQNAIKSLLWLYQEFGEAVRPVVVPILATLAGRPESIPDLYASLADNVDGQRLLKEPEFSEPLETLGKDPTVTQEVQDKVRELLEIRQISYRWPQLWLAPRLREWPMIEQWLELVGLEHNPFGPEWAELEPLLPDYSIYPAVLEPERGSLRGTRPAILFGREGMGRTATALLLAHDCTYPPPNPREKKVFPAYSNLSLDDAIRMTRSTYLDFVVGAVGEALIHFFAMNPYTFLEHTSSRKRAIACLLVQVTGSPEALRIRLNQARLSSDGAGQRLLAEVTEIGNELTSGIKFSEAGRLELLQCARPASFTNTYVLVDTAAALIEKERMPEVARHLQPLLGLIIPLAGAGDYLKLFLPDMLKPHLSIPSDIVTGTLQWSQDELKDLLKTHLSTAGCSGLIQLFDTRSEEIPGLTDSLVNAAEGSPRRLIQLGNQLIKEHVTRNPGVAKISREILDAVLGQSMTGGKT